MEGRRGREREKGNLCKNANTFWMRGEDSDVFPIFGKR